MRRVSRRQQRWKRRHERYRKERHARSKKLRKLRALLRNVNKRNVGSVRLAQAEFRGHRVLLTAPETFGISTNYERTKLMDFLNEIQRLCQAGVRISLDFSHSKKMEPSGTLLFMAVLDRELRRSSAGSIACNYPKNPIVEQLLQHLGFLQRLGLRSRTTISADNVKYWRYTSGEAVDGEKADPTISDYKELFPDGTPKKLYAALAEAMTNSKQHAYLLKDGSAALSSGWWMFSQFRQNALFVCICDLGVGIPTSLLSGRKWTSSHLRDRWRKIATTHKRRDSAFIRAAVELGKSRTDQKYRGKGLPELKSLIESASSGWLRIMSNRGCYVYSVKNGYRDSLDYDASIGGTLIEWRIDRQEGV